MHNERDFLNRVREALGRTTSSPVDPALFNPRPEGEREARLTQAQRTPEERAALLALLKEAAVPLNLNVHEAATPDEAGEAIADIARNADTEWGGEKRLTLHDNPEIEALGLKDRLAGDGIAVDVAALLPDEDEMQGKQRLRAQAEAAFIGVTGANWGVADCGAIALLAGPGRGRATSLVPSIHIAVLPLERLLADLPELYAQLEDTELPTSFNFISGPSKTADIEAQLVHGAHGPREMHLIVVTG
ncbi:lactate utilization protein C [Pseudodesulfovibrio cashew]|uniref:Lactate utilization protein C n=1 Tax=Pseudodesulfovibrio cashew TaxID=2678688 RepID=A0A6I6JS75_9BACT|nr:lactate utilization protein [Pseudodesulfovibrio cashew]QGY40404.1 lactate utilization protein C [Pseudodesulfovibrio cashew]